MRDPWGTYDYEAWMFRGTAPAIQVPNPCRVDPLIHINAFVASRLLYTWILCGILLSRGSKADDIKLDKLLPGFSSPLIDQLRKRLWRRQDAGNAVLGVAQASRAHR